MIPLSEVSGEPPRLGSDRADMSEELFDRFEEFSEYPGGNMMLSTYTRMCHYYDLDGLFVGWEDPHDSDFGGIRLYHPLETIFFRRYRGQMNIMCYTADGMKFMDAGEYPAGLLATHGVRSTSLRTTFGASTDIGAFEGACARLLCAGPWTWSENSHTAQGHNVPQKQRFGRHALRRLSIFRHNVLYLNTIRELIRILLAIT